MKILFVTDLHGNEAKFRRGFDIARETGAKAVINGGDMLCHGADIHKEQREFIEGFLDGHFAEYEQSGIYHLGYLGNDDLRIYDPLFDSVCSKYKYAVNLAQSRFELYGFEFIGMNWVTDYPFRLKDRCRRDGPGYVFQEQFGSGLLSTPEGFKELPAPAKQPAGPPSSVAENNRRVRRSCVAENGRRASGSASGGEDWPAYAATLPTIENELAALPKPKTVAKTVYVIHMPPSGLGLDVTDSGEEVGSKAVSRFIKKTGPLLTLHGHIHESPSMSGVWKAKIGKTVCIQPGQMKGKALSYVLINLKSMELERFEEPL
ncbi:MAG: metallophosphoesterase [Elusimicrobia bacterium]|nr:metallophosphoesterase [Elusimicrobiota bacterium]